MAFFRCEQLQVTPLFSCPHRSPRCWKHPMTWAKTALTFQWKGLFFFSGYQLPFHSTAPSHCLTGCTTVTPEHSKSCCFQKKFVVSKEKKKSLQLSGNTKHLFPSCLMAGFWSWGIFVSFGRRDLSKHLEREADCVGGYMGRSDSLLHMRGRTDLSTVCDLPLDHPAAQQTGMGFCHTNSWLCTPMT